METELNIKVEVSHENNHQLELFFQDISACLLNSIDQKQKVILRNCTGIFSPKTFTALLGPSGSGKTTLLNILSGRLFAQDIKVNGKILLNSKQISDFSIYSENIGFVMQEDLLYSTLTPRQCFEFVVNLKLFHLSEQEKINKIQHIIDTLELEKAADTLVGNSLIRGISGGEKKRTAIGIQLLTDPYLVFLDEPTTGLDSETALHLIQFLNQLAKEGKTIISTIHQPSSQIYKQFDRLILMAEGNIVFQGNTDFVISYFNRINMPIPLNSNPCDYFMEILNKQGLVLQSIQSGEPFDQQQIGLQFEKHLAYLIKCYEQEKHVFEMTISTDVRNQKNQKISFFKEFSIIFERGIKNILKNPLDFRSRIISQIVRSLISIIVYYQKSDQPFSMIQNTEGNIMLILNGVTIGALFSNVNAFNFQRPVYIRERISNTYSTSAYFWGRTFATLPFQILMPMLFLCLCYFFINLTDQTSIFFKALLTVELVSWNASSFGFLISALSRNAEMAGILTPLFFLPLVMVVGYFRNVNDAPKVFFIFEYISFFTYGYQALITNNYPSEINCGKSFGTCNILQIKYKFPLSFWWNLILLLIIGIVVRIIAFIFLYRLGNPEKFQIQAKEKQQMKRISV